MILKIGTINLYLNPFFCPDKSIIKLWEKYLLSIRKAGSSCGAIIELEQIACWFRSSLILKTRYGSSICDDSINAVKGVNIGSGMNSAQLTGEQNSDEISQISSKTDLIQIIGGILEVFLQANKL